MIFLTNWQFFQWRHSEVTRIPPHGSSWCLQAKKNQRHSTLELLPMERRCHRRRCGADRCFANFGFRSSVSSVRVSSLVKQISKLKVGICFPANSGEKKINIWKFLSQFRIVVPYREKPRNSALQRASMPMAPIWFLEGWHLDNDLPDSFNAMEP